MSILVVGRRYAAWRASPSTPGRRTCDTSGSLSLSRCPSAKVRDWRSAAGPKERRWPRLMILHFSSRVVYMQLMSRYFIPSSAECCWRGRGRLSLRPGGHRASCLGRSHRWELGRTHQSGRDVPPKKRGERRLEVKKKVWETCQMLNSSLLSILTVVCFRESHTSSGTSSMIS